MFLESMDHYQIILISTEEEKVRSMMNVECGGSPWIIVGVPLACLPVLGKSSVMPAVAKLNHLRLMNVFCFVFVLNWNTCRGFHCDWRLHSSCSLYWSRCPCNWRGGSFSEYNLQGLLNFERELLRNIFQEKTIKKNYWSIYILG